MTLHEQMTADIDFILNADEHAESHELGGVTADMIVDDVESPRNQAQALGLPWQGLAARRRTVLIALADFTEAFITGQMTSFDGEQVTVVDVRTDEGAALLSLDYLDDSQQLQSVTVTHYATGDGYTAPAVRATEADIPCRYLLTDEEVLLPDGGEVTSKARFSFGVRSGLLELLVGDEIEPSDLLLTFRVVRIEEDRGIGGDLAQRTAWAVKVVR